MHLKSQLVQAINEVLAHIQQIELSVCRSLHLNTSSTGIKNGKTAMDWILGSKIRMVLFANLVDCQLHISQGVSRVINLSPLVLDHMRVIHVDLTCAFAKLINGRVDVTPWLSKVYGPSAKRVHKC